MGVGAGLYMYDVVVKSSRLLSHLLMSSCIHRRNHEMPPLGKCRTGRTPFRYATDMYSQHTPQS